MNGKIGPRRAYRIDFRFAAGCHGRVMALFLRRNGAAANLTGGICFVAASTFAAPGDLSLADRSGTASRSTREQFKSTLVTVGESFGGAFGGTESPYVGDNDPGYSVLEGNAMRDKTVFTFGPTSEIAFGVERAERPAAHQPLEADRARRVQSN